MRALTPSERRGALTLVVLLLLGAARDLIAPHEAPPPGGAPPQARPAAAQARAAAPDSGAGAGLVDLNHASAEELDRLPGVGPVLAQRILAYRRRFGGFDSADELRAVRGVGPRLFARLRPRVVVAPGRARAGAGSGAPAGMHPARPGSPGGADSAQAGAARDR